MPSRLPSTLVCLVLLFSIACGGSSASPDAAVNDAHVAVDAVEPTDAAQPTETSVALEYGTGEGTLDRAFLGYHRGSSGEVDGLYFELSRGADDACPSETSPTPDQIITIDQFDAAEPATRTDATLVIHFFDFEGTFRDELAPAAPTVASVEVTALDLEAGTATANVLLTFGEDGSAIGSLLATHCDSLDSVD